MYLHSCDRPKVIYDSRPRRDVAHVSCTIKSLVQPTTRARRAGGRSELVRTYDGRAAAHDVVRPTGESRTSFASLAAVLCRVTTVNRLFTVHRAQVSSRPKVRF